MLPPDLDAVGGRSYRQSSQTAGALGGRRDVVQWHSTGEGIDLVVMIQSNTGGSPNTFKAKTVQLVGGVWTLFEDGPSISQFNLNVLSFLGGNLYRIRARRDNNNIWVRGAVGQLERSSDGGNTWLPVGPTPFEDDDVANQEWGISDIAISADGTLWACAGPTAHVNEGIVSSSVANPTVITTGTTHGLTTGDKIIIEGHISVTPQIDNHESGNPSTWTVTVLSPTTFTIPVNVTNGGIAGNTARATHLSRIYKSTPASNGLVWTEEFSDEFADISSFIDLYCGIFCHPTDPNIIVVVSNNGIGIGSILHTLDAGDIWVENHPTGFSQQGGAGRRVIMWDNGRALFFLGNITDTAVISDDFGVTVDATGLAAAIDNGQFVYDYVSAPDGLCFVLGGSVLNPQVVRTKDYGATWENIFDGGTDFINNFGPMTAIAYNPVHDIIYLGSAATTSSGGALPRIRAIDQASQILAADVGSQTWRDLQFNLDSVFDRGIAHAGVAVR